MLETVGSEGYERTTVQAAIERAGVYRQAFYDAFSDKQDCYLQALEEGRGWLEEEIRAAAGGEETWREQLRGGLAGLLRFLDRRPDVGRALLVEVHAAGPRAVATRTAALQLAARHVDRARDEAATPAPAIAAEAVVAGILSVLHARLASGRVDGFARLLPELAYLAVLPYFGPGEAAAEMRASGV